MIRFAKRALRFVLRITFFTVMALIAISFVGLSYHQYKIRTGYDAYKAHYRAMYQKIVTKSGQRPMPPLYFNDSSRINAYASPMGFVVITKGMMNFVKNDDEMALVMGHEIAHIMLWHFETSKVTGVQKEAHSDKLGSWLAARAGYDICKGSEIWKRLTEKQGDYAVTQSHPSMMYRYYQLQMPWCW